MMIRVLVLLLLMSMLLASAAENATADTDLFPEPPTLLTSPSFRVDQPSFCELRGEDKLHLHDPSHKTSNMRMHGGPACKFLPFAEWNHSRMKYNLIYRHVPKAGSSTVGHLLGRAWEEIWAVDGRRGLEMRHRVKIERVLNCVDPQLQAARRGGQTIEFTVSREPLARFISAYFYTETNYLRDPTTHKVKLPKVDLGRAGLLHFLGTLPDGCNNGHLFPQYYYYCSCGRILRYKQHKTVTYSHSCARALRFVLRLESIGRDWNELMTVAAPGMVHTWGAAPRVNVGKHAPRVETNTGMITSAFAKFNVPDANAPEITDKICGYLQNDYDVLSDLYPPPPECRYPFAVPRVAASRGPGAVDAAAPVLSGNRTGRLKFHRHSIASDEAPGSRPGNFHHPSKTREK